jgi:hypothetical protein
MIRTVTALFLATALAWPPASFAGAPGELVVIARSISLGATLPSGDALLTIGLSCADALKYLQTSNFKLIDSNAGKYVFIFEGPSQTQFLGNAVVLIQCGTI